MRFFCGGTVGYPCAPTNMGSLLPSLTTTLYCHANWSTSRSVAPSLRKRNSATALLSDECVFNGDCRAEQTKEVYFGPSKKSVCPPRKKKNLAAPFTEDTEQKSQKKEENMMLISPSSVAIVKVKICVIELD